MNRIKDYSKLKYDIIGWLKDYYWFHGMKAFVVGVSGGIDSAVVSTLCAETEQPTYILTMPLHSKNDNTKLSENISGFVEEVKKNKPTNVKGNYVNSVYISSSMGVGIKVSV